MVKTMLVGIKKFVSKDGRDFRVLEISKTFNDRELNNGCIGSKVEEIFVPDGMFDKVDLLTVGKPIKLDYEVDGNRAYLVDFSTEK